MMEGKVVTAFTQMLAGQSTTNADDSEDLIQGTTEAQDRANANAGDIQRIIERIRGVATRSDTKSSDIKRLIQRTRDVENMMRQVACSSRWPTDRYCRVAMIPPRPPSLNKRRTVGKPAE